MRAGVQRAKDLKDHSLSSSNNPNNTQDSTNTAKSESQKNENKWIDQMHGNLLVTATLIATVSFQAGINPPGGVWQDSSNGHITGTSIIATTFIFYFSFVLNNTVALISSSSIILLMISGFPHNSNGSCGQFNVSYVHNNCIHVTNLLFISTIYIYIYIY